jgi:hypothetical protein
MIRFDSPLQSRPPLAGNESTSAAPGQPTKTLPAAPFLSPQLESGKRKKIFVTIGEKAVGESEHGSPRANEYYVTLPAGYEVPTSDGYIEAMICQPTPAGMQILVNEFRKNTGCDLHLLDQPGRHSIKDLFAAFPGYVEANIHLADGDRVGVILSQGQNHAVPVILASHEGQRYLFIFDSTSGGQTRQYYHVANACPDFRVLLNAGTRQADSQSCITDSYEILCRALQLPELCKLILNKVNAGGEAGSAAKADDAVGAGTAESNSFISPGSPKLQRPRFIGVTLKRDNFQLFQMPEELCFTAQRSDFIEKGARADLHKQYLVDNKLTTLARELSASKKFSYWTQEKMGGDAGEKDHRRDLKNYLYSASRRHKQIIDNYLASMGDMRLREDFIAPARRVLFTDSP